MVFIAELTSGPSPEDGLSVAAQVFVLGWLWVVIDSRHLTNTHTVTSYYQGSLYSLRYIGPTLLLTEVAGAVLRWVYLGCTQGGR